MALPIEEMLQPPTASNCHPPTASTCTPVNEAAGERLDSSSDGEQSRNPMPVATMRTISSKGSSAASSLAPLIEERLKAGVRAKRKLRSRVSGTMLAFGCTLGFASQFFYLVDGLSNWGWPSGCAWAVVVACIIILGLAPLQDDIKLTRCVLLANIGNVTCDFFWHGRTVLSYVRLVQEGTCEYCGVNVPRSAYCYLSISCGSAYLFADVVFAMGAFIIVFCKSVLLMQTHMWNIVVFYLAFMLVADVGYAVGTVVEIKCVDGTAMFVITDIVGLVVALHPSLRSRTHSWLIQRFESHGATAAAAGIASLVGDFPPEKALAESCLRFRAIPLSQIPFDCLLASPILESGFLFEKASHVKLGRCDAFVSHSWHDDPILKWQVLQKWRNEFVEEKGREPMVWFDKACIDQNNIEDDLRCLPIFLSGCKDLLVCCGSTYLSRLWCIMEIFTFVHMGGSVERIRMLPLTRDGFQCEDADSIRAHFRDFDAEMCQCFCSDDKERMLAIISAAFGGMAGFNNAVREIIDQVQFSGTNLITQPLPLELLMSQTPSIEC